MVLIVYQQSFVKIACYCLLPVENHHYDNVFLHVSVSKNICYIKITPFLIYSSNASSDIIKI